jgi:hypothetical protein
MVLSDRYLFTLPEGPSGEEKAGEVVVRHEDIQQILQLLKDIYWTLQHIDLELDALLGGGTEFEFPPPRIAKRRRDGRSVHLAGSDRVRILP